MIWGLLGIIATVLIGLLPFLLSKKHACRITYIPTESFNLYNNLASNFGNLKVLNRNKPIENNLVFLSGTFVSNGGADIPKDKHEIKIELPEGYKWLDCKINRTSREFTPSIKIDEVEPKILKANFDLFKNEEYFSIQSLVECENGVFPKDVLGFHRGLNFFHRIESVSSIEVREPITQKKAWRRFFILMGLFVIFLFSTLYSVNSSFKTNRITYRDINSGEICFAYLASDGNVVIQNYNAVNMIVGTTDKKISIKSFQSNYEPTAYCNLFNYNKIAYLLSVGLTLVLFAIMLIPEYIQIRNNNKLYSLYHSLE